MEVLNRREVASRKVGFFKKAAFKLSAMGISPNQISVMSVIFASVGAFCIYKFLTSTGYAELLPYGILSLVGIQGRLICNLLDGLVAIEGGKKTAVGDLYNEVPDRLSDTLLLVAAGLGLSQVGFNFGTVLGVLASLAALGTAYVRVLGGSLSLPQSFRGPMAKQHRMALLNLGIILSLAEFGQRNSLGFAMFGVLGLILIGAFLTTYLRLRDIACELNAR